MPRSPKDNQEIRDARREEILAAATRVFTEKGLAQAKINDIAAAAGLSHGLVYHYFASKEAIFGAIVDQMIEKIRGEMELDPGLSPLQQIIASIERSRVETCQGGVDARRVVSQAMMQGALPDAIRKKLASHFKQIHRRAVTVVRQAQESGEVDREIDAEELAAALICLMRGMSIRMPGFPTLPFTPPRTDTILRLLRPAGALQETALRQTSPRHPNGAGHPNGARHPKGALPQTLAATPEEKRTPEEKGAPEKGATVPRRQPRPRAARGTHGTRSRRT